MSFSTASTSTDGSAYAGGRRIASSCDHTNQQISLNTAISLRCPPVARSCCTLRSWLSTCCAFCLSVWTSRCRHAAVQCLRSVCSHSRQSAPSAYDRPPGPPVPRVPRPPFPKPADPLSRTCSSAIESSCSALLACTDQNASNRSRHAEAQKHTKNARRRTAVGRACISCAISPTSACFRANAGSSSPRRSLASAAAATARRAVSRSSRRSAAWANSSVSCSSSSAAYALRPPTFASCGTQGEALCMHAGVRVCGAQGSACVRGRVSVCVRVR